MLTSTLCTLVLFARTVIASGKPAKTKVIESRNGVDFKIPMTKNDLERMKEIPMAFDGVLEPVDNEASMVQETLQAWNTLLKEKEHKGHDSIRTDCDAKGIVHPSGEVEEQFEGVAAWKGERVRSEEHLLLIIREISPNLYEWMYITIDLQSKLTFNTLDFWHLDQVEFVCDKIDERYFTEISSLYAQQRIQQLQDDIAELLSSPGEQKKLVHLRAVQQHLDGHIAKLKVDLLDHQESDKSAAIQREIEAEKLRKEIKLREAVATKCTRWQSEVEKLTAEKAETERKHQEDIVRQQEKADELITEKSSAGADRARLLKHFEDRKSEWDEAQKSTQRQLEESKLQSKALDGKKAENDQLIQRFRETQNVLEKQNGDLRTNLAKSEGEIKLLSERLGRANDENNEFKDLIRNLSQNKKDFEKKITDLRTNLDTSRGQIEEHEQKMAECAEKQKELKEMKAQLQSEIASLQDENTKTQRELDADRVRHTEQLQRANAKKDTAEAHNKELQDKLAKSEEEQTKLEATNNGLLNDIGSLRDEKKQVDDRQQDLEVRNAETQRELDLERNLHEAAVEVEQKLREKEEIIDHWIMISMFIGGGMLVVIGFIIFQLARNTYNEMFDDMEYELNEQLKRVKEPHPLVPVIPSAHANRLGVHEHPAVRDVFGMKEPWDVTSGEGFHVARVTKSGKTPGTSGGEVEDEATGVPVMEGMSESD